ncbi:hypothetical protein M513_08303 [Trichuris suis]|uniref:WAP domain-containing protein n=1 Tax=Trichuris suis TaxID=68888 RepID=A0A085M0W9_9BILA|nr:hypothetical protein M513_08303 [Trichuris suis]
MTFLFLVGICFYTLHVTASEKSGLCPPEPRIRGELVSCQADSDCPGKRKCCYTVKGRECVRAKDSGMNNGQCPPSKPRLSGKWIDLCSNDGNCPGKQKCCDTEMGNRCMDLSGKTSNKKGLCPPEPRITGTTVKCAADNDCPGIKKCCYTVDGRECVKPKDGRKASTSTGKAPGKCPPAGERIPGKWVDKCRRDSNCPKNQKCCDTEMGNRCMDVL